MKKQLILFLVMLLPMIANAYDFTVDGIYYTILTNENSNNVIVSKGDIHYEGDVIIPTMVKYNDVEYIVKGIDSKAFKDCTRLKKIVIPETIETLDATFWGCSRLQSVDFPSSLKEIGTWTFLDCSSLENVTLPSNLKKIGHWAFSGCLSLKSIIIPQSVSSIEQAPFENCPQLESIIVEDGNNYYDSRNNCQAIINTNTNHLISGCKNSFIPSDVIAIDYRAFYGCTRLKTISLPEGLTEIGTGAFQECTGLTSIKLPSTLKKIETQLFDGCTSLESVDIPSGVSNIGGYAFFKCTSLSSIMIPLTIMEIGQYAFAYSSINSITIPEGVTIIERNTFYECHSLNQIILPSTLKNIENGAFERCYSLYDVWCYASYAPYTSSSSFTSSPYQYATLHVPSASMNDYEEVEPWKSFRTIVGIGAKYNLTYQIDGEVYKTYEMEYDETITPEPAPSKEGYTFSGWSEIPETMPAHDVTVTGTFSINKYKLTYIVDGQTCKTYDVEYGSAITPEAEPMKEGYTFSGWSEIPETMPAHDVTVTGTFTINKYKLTYIIDGNEYKSYELDYGASITPDVDPTKEGYTFLGWSEIPETMPAHDVTVTGTFSINSYNLTYMIDDKVYKEIMYEYGATITPEPQPEGVYATFEWIDLPLTMPAHDVVVYASYTSGIIEVLMAAQHNVRIYSPNGKKLNKLQKGLNIVIFDDGTVKKIVVK